MRLGDAAHGEQIIPTVQRGMGCGPTLELATDISINIESFCSLSTHLLFEFSDSLDADGSNNPWT